MADYARAGPRTRSRDPRTPFTRGARGGSGAAADATFALPFSDLGAGAVSLVVRRSTGSGTPSFTRATAAATRTGALAAGVGYIWNLGVASGTARSYYDANGNYGGFLSESAATQIITNTRDLSQVAWVKVNMTAALTSTGLENVANSCSRVTCVVGGDTILQTIVAAASTRTFSAYVKRVTGSGTVTMNNGGTALDITALINTSTFTLVQSTDSTLNTTVGFTITTAADAIDVDCCQFEAGTFATTPIPAAGTRNADVLLYVMTNNANAVQGSCSAKILSIPTASSGTNRSIVAFATANQGPLMLLAADANTVIEVFDGTNTLQKTGLSNCATAPRTRVSAWGSPSQIVTSDGLAPTAGTFDGNMGSTNIAIGCDTSSATQFNGAIQSVSIWAQKFSNSELQTASMT